jgi:uncharacterized protein YndB with AHSA1/START domain
MKEIHGTATARVDVPAEKVFELITDLDRLPDWNAAIEAVEQRPAALCDGAEWRVVMHPRHTPRWRSVSSVRVVDPTNLRFAYETRNADGNPSYATWTWEIDPGDGVATVTVRWDVYLKTLDRKLIGGPLRRRQLAHEVPSSLRALASTLAADVAR